MNQPELSLKELKELLKELNGSLDFFENHFPKRTALERISIAVFRLQQEVDNIEVPKTVGEDRIIVVLEQGLKMRFV